MINTILFDLDGTLLPIDTDQFIKHYLKKLSSYISEFAEPGAFVKQVMASTFAMIQSKEEHLTNQQVFEADFYPKVGVAIEILGPHIDRFYAEEFPKLQEFVDVHPFVPEMISLLKERGYRLVVATNPLFPRSAILDRIKWAGLDPDDFTWITSYEVCHFSKPNPKYFLEIAKQVGVDPQECIMIGNDAQEDLIAQQVGMKTYLVTDHKIDRQNSTFTPDGEGKMIDLFHEIKEKRGLFK